MGNNQNLSVDKVLIFIGGLLILGAMYSLWFGATTLTWLLIYNGLGLVFIGRFFKGVIFGKTNGRILRITLKEKESAENGKIIEEQKYNKFAIIGFILPFFAVYGGSLFGIVGLLLGVVARLQIKYNNEKGKGLAIAAITIGFIWSFVIDLVKRLT